jgi:hypothetical protein
MYCASFHNYYMVYNEKDTIREKHWQESWRNKKNSSLLYVLVKKAYDHLISVALQESKKWFTRIRKLFETDTQYLNPAGEQAKYKN